MNLDKTILSTKKLTLAQKELLLNSGLAFIEYNAIEIQHLKFQWNQGLVHNAIFTSKNSLKILENTELQIKNCFCVGQVTKKLLEDQGFNIVEFASNAEELAKIIVQNYKEASFHFFCGNLRREALPEILHQNEVNLKEHIVYHTKLCTKKFNRNFDGILFFSPSAVKSYVSTNTLSDSTSFCIGKTTASAAKKYFEKVVIANQPSIENVIVQAVKHMQQY